VTRDSVAIKPAATTLLLRDDNPFQVLMMRRNRKAVFAGDMWVFPGGRVEPSEQSDLASYQAFASPVGEPLSAFHLAAIRELFEEAGILLARQNKEKNLVKLTANPELLAVRESLHKGETDLLQILTKWRLTLANDWLHSMARWVTPPGALRRFDTRFFVGRLPVGQIPCQDNSELVEQAFFSPLEALDAHRKGEMRMMTPTLNMLATLACFESIEQLLEALAKTTDELRVRVDSTGQLLYPDDKGYETASTDTEFGWVRLRPRIRVHVSGGQPSSFIRN